MAVIRNITPDARSLFSADAPPVHAADCGDCEGPCNEVTVRDQRFVGRAWPASTWELVEAPSLDGYVDVSTDEALMWVHESEAPAPIVDLESMTVDDLKAHAAAAGIDLGGATKKADILAALTSSEG